jgi:hypothetical protein
MKNVKLFEKQVQEAWTAVKGAYHKKYHAQLRSTMLKLIAKEDSTYPEFVSLMSVSGWDPVAEIFSKMESKAAGGVGRYKNVNKALAEEAAAKEQEEPEEPDDKRVLHQCHYCGDMYHVSELMGAKEGLICYKCRHEMENRD